jgi:hypothetical protein
MKVVSLSRIVDVKRLIIAIQRGRCIGRLVNVILLLGLSE